METLPFVSVIVPALNEGDYIATCLDSLMKIQYPSSKHEIIVVDNGSMDNTAQVIRKYPVQSVFEPKRGAAAARNRGAAIARGSVLAFVDADCAVCKHWLEAITHILCNGHNIHGVMGPSRGVNRSLWAEFRQRQVEEFIAEASMGGDNVSKAATTSFAILKSVFNKVGGFDERYLRAHDIELSIRLHSHGYKIAFEPRAWVLHMHPTDLQEIAEIRRMHGFYTYKIVQQHDFLSRKYFPEFGRWYYRFIFSTNAAQDKKVLEIFRFSLSVQLRGWSTLLESLHRLGFRNSLFPLFAFFMDLNFFYGKILARLSDAGDTKISINGQKV